jgi:hypothetical protein
MLASILHGAPFTATLKRLATQARKLLDPPRQRQPQIRPLLKPSRPSTA